jgi:hypothetical protein
LGRTLGLGATPFIDHGLHGSVHIEEGLVHMSSGREASMMNLWA